MITALDEGCSFWGLRGGRYMWTLLFSHLLSRYLKASGVRPNEFTFPDNRIANIQSQLERQHRNRGTG